MAGNVKEVSDSNFQETVLDHSLPTLVDFWAPWCGPCRMVGPVVEELSVEFDGKVQFVKLNTDENPRTATNYNIRSIPSLILFKDGKVKDMRIGALPKEQLKEFVQSNM